MVMVQPEKDRNGVEMRENTIRKCKIPRKKRKKMAVRAYDQERG